MGVRKVRINVFASTWGNDEKDAKSGGDTDVREVEDISIVIVY